MKHRVKRDYAFTGVTLLVILLVLVLLLSVLMNLRNLNLGAGGGSAISPVSSFSRPHIYSLKNISYGFSSNSDGSPAGIVPIISINRIGINASPDIVYPEQNPDVHINVIYSGTFAFESYNVTEYLKNTINFYYVGFYMGNGSIYIIGNGDAGRYFIENGTPLIYTPENENSTHYMALRMQVNATDNATGIWNFCAGFFGSYKNDSSWNRSFYNLSDKRTNFTNTSMVNLVSGDCKQVDVK